MDPLHLCIALGPVARYFLLLGSINLSRRPFVTSGTRDAAALGIAIVGGVLGLLLFDQAFELFHRLFFPPGSYLFDPSTERLTQLFPQAFWIESSIAVGAAVIALATGMWWVARRRVAAAESRATGAASAAQGSVATS